MQKDFSFHTDCLKRNFFAISFGKHFLALHSNALWPTDLVSKGIPSKVLLSGSDEIVPVRDVERLFQDFSDHVETYTFENASHGDMFVDESMRSLALEKIISVMNLSRQIENTETALGTKHELTDPVTV